MSRAQSLRFGKQRDHVFDITGGRILPACAGPHFSNRVTQASIPPSNHHKQGHISAGEQERVEEVSVSEKPPNRKLAQKRRFHSQQDPLFQRPQPEHPRNRLFGLSKSPARSPISKAPKISNPNILPKRSSTERWIEISGCGVHIVNEPRIGSVVRALHAQPQLRVSQLAPMVDLSPNYLERLFKKHVGTSITEYSMEVRLLRASELLVTTFHSVKEIRNEAGIPDGSNFAHRFKKRFGIPPSEYGVLPLTGGRIFPNSV